MGFGQVPNQHVLRPVRVLVLVDHDVAELARVELARLLRRVEELDRLEQQVVEVEGVAVAEQGHIALEDPRDLLVPDVVGVAEGSGAFHAVAQVADPGECLPRRDELVVDVELFLDLLDEGDLIGGVVDDEITRQSDLLRFAPEDRAQSA